MSPTEAADEKQNPPCYKRRLQALCRDGYCAFFRTRKLYVGLFVGLYITVNGGMYFSVCVRRVVVAIYSAKVKSVL